MDTLLSIRIFVRVAEMSSFTAVAEQMRMSTAMISKHVKHLEQQLATRLLNRTSRRVSLTEAGTLYLNRVRLALEGLDQAKAAVGETTTKPAGKLRISAPVWVACEPFVAAIAGYRAQHPDVQIEIDLSGRMANIVDEGFDLALRATSTLDSKLVARRLFEMPFHLVGSPAYFARAGRPTSLETLKGRELLAYPPILSNNAIPLSSAQGHHQVVFRPVLESTNETFLRLAALEGMGLALLPEWLVCDDLAKGRLEPALPGVGASTGLFAVYPQRAFLSANVRTFLDYLGTTAGLAKGIRRLRKTHRPRPPRKVKSRSGRPGVKS